MVTLNRIVAVAMVHGPKAALEQLATTEADPALAGHHRVEVVLERHGSVFARNRAAE
jgi:predicted RNA polymerase sigma factor